MSLNKTVLDFPEVASAANGDWLYIVRGTDLDRDKKLKIDSLLDTYVNIQGNWSPPTLAAVKGNLFVSYSFETPALEMSADLTGLANILPVGHTVTIALQDILLPTIQSRALRLIVSYYGSPDSTTFESMYLMPGETLVMTSFGDYYHLCVMPKIAVGGNIQQPTYPTFASLPYKTGVYVVEQATTAVAGGPPGIAEKSFEVTRRMPNNGTDGTSKGSDIVRLLKSTTDTLFSDVSIDTPLVRKTWYRTILGSGTFTPWASVGYGPQNSLASGSDLNEIPDGLTMVAYDVANVTNGPGAEAIVGYYLLEQVTLERPDSPGGFITTQKFSSLADPLLEYTRSCVTYNSGTPTRAWTDWKNVVDPFVRRSMVSNLNTATTPGYYSVAAAATNAPKANGTSLLAGGGLATLQVFDGSGDSSAPYTVTVQHLQADNGSRWSRQSINSGSTWTKWQQSNYPSYDAVSGGPNIDTIKRAGRYPINNLGGVIPGYTWIGVLEVLVSDTAPDLSSGGTTYTVTQRFVSASLNTLSDPPKEFIRCYVKNTTVPIDGWTAWVETTASGSGGGANSESYTLGRNCSVGPSNPFAVGIPNGVNDGTGTCPLGWSPLKTSAARTSVKVQGVVGNTTGQNFAVTVRKSSTLPVNPTDGTAIGSVMTATGNPLKYEFSQTITDTMAAGTYVWVTVTSPNGASATVTTAALYFL